jgi:hypothetical protein
VRSERLLIEQIDDCGSLLVVMHHRPGRLARRRGSASVNETADRLIG